MGVAAEVLEEVLSSREGGLGVDVPRQLRDRSCETREALGLLEVGDALEVALAVGTAQRCEHLRAEDDAHRLDGEETRWSRPWCLLATPPNLAASNIKEGTTHSRGRRTSASAGARGGYGEQQRRVATSFDTQTESLGATVWLC